MNLPDSPVCDLTPSASHDTSPGLPANPPALDIPRPPDVGLTALVDHLASHPGDAIPRSSALCKALGWPAERLRSVVVCGVAEGVLTTWEKEPGDPSVMLTDLEAKRRGMKLRTSESKGQDSWSWVPAARAERRARHIVHKRAGGSRGLALESELTRRCDYAGESGFDFDSEPDTRPTTPSAYIDACTLYSEGKIRREYLEEAAKGGITPYRVGFPWDGISDGTTRKEGHGPDAPEPPRKVDPGPDDGCPECGGEVRPGVGMSPTTYCLRCDRSAIAIPAGERLPEGEDRRRGPGKDNPMRSDPLPAPMNPYERELYEELRGKKFRKKQGK